MSEAELYRGALVVFGALAVITFPALFFASAPYGRHRRSGFGPTINATVGWMVMESPAVIGMLLCYALGGRRGGVVGAVLLLLWEMHYMHRTFVFPWRRRRSAGQMPLFVVASSWSFNLVNAYLNGRWLYELGPELTTSWLADPRFIVGLSLFVAGFAINLHADEVLLGLRRSGGGGYKIPQGGLYRWISCPNYLGEIIEWCGFALCAWSPASLAFALWTVANLAPRARSHHLWYKERFPEYPEERRAILPYIF